MSLPIGNEIKEAVWFCDPTKSPGLDGYNLNFIQKMWGVIGSDFKDMVWQFFTSGSLPKKLNMAWVTLIPKFEGANEIKDFNPISMVGCVYKIITKILARRLSVVMGSLVGEVQTAFIKGRQILDGALIACETVH